MNIAINGFGRIGRCFLRAVLLDPIASKKLNVAVINVGPCSIKNTAHTFAYDSVMGAYPGIVRMEGNILHIDNHEIEIIAEADPKNINWQQWDIEWVVESSGHFTHREKAELHIDKAGAKNVLITAPAKGDIVTIIPGINMQDYNTKKDHIVSLGSCTTNAVVPLLKVLHDVFTLEQAFMTSIHAYTNSQSVLDSQDGDVRKSRAAAINIIPTTTGASRVVTEVLPFMQNKFEGIAIRVPVAKVSLIDLVFHTKKELTVSAINENLEKAATKDFSKIVAFTKEELVSSDYVNNPHSVIVDGPLTSANGTMGKIFGWYDNEWGYSERLKDFLLYAQQN